MNSEFYSFNFKTKIFPEKNKNKLIKNAISSQYDQFIFQSIYSI